MSTLAQEKDLVRKRVWERLQKVARPDSRHHFDFSSFIADFDGSDQATERLVCLPAYLDSDVVFITPDNCLEDLRLRALQDGKTVLMTTYAIRRGFWVLDPKRIVSIGSGGSANFVCAAMLDGMERFGEALTLADMAARDWHIGLMVTGTGAVNRAGVRFGKGHGFFDLEWAILFTLGMVSQDKTVTVGLVHDCQVVEEDEEEEEGVLCPELFDTVCDFVVTPTRVIQVQGCEVRKPSCGILWPLLQPDMLESIPPLRELKEMGLKVA